MDCLPPGEYIGVRGPDAWADAARAPAAFVEALAGEGFGGTLFVAPEALHGLKAALEGLRGAQCELALLCHPQMAGYPACLGAYGYERQVQIVSQAAKLWADATGEAPVSFRPGFFSANDFTFQVLCMRGFRQGSCSLPGRMDNEQCSMWFNSYPFPHHTDPLDRTGKGTTEFFEVPVTSDFEAASYVSYETFTPPHLRIEEPGVHEYARELVTRHLDGMGEDGLEVPVLHLVTSNLVGWGRPEDPHVEKLSNLCAMLREVAEQRNVKLAWGSLKSIHEQTDAELRKKRVQEELA
jgi:hypothetical protein